jgi:RND family efflux transporter MFP subunit
MKSILILGGLALAACASGLAHAAEYSAELGWSGVVSLAMPVTGVVETVGAQPGQRFKKGELLAALNPVQFKAAVAEARAEADRLALELADARKDLDRVKELYARTVSATSELDAAQLRHDRAAAAQAGAQARLDRARRQLEESELRAPFDVVILARMAEPGLVAATPCQPNPLFTVARADEFTAQATLSPERVAHLAPGLKAEVLVGGRSLKGEIRGISVRDDGKYRLEVGVPREKGMMPGQAATLRLP